VTLGSETSAAGGRPGAGGLVRDAVLYGVPHEVPEESLELSPVGTEPDVRARHERRAGGVDVRPARLRDVGDRLGLGPVDAAVRACQRQQVVDETAYPAVGVRDLPEAALDDSRLDDGLEEFRRLRVVVAVPPDFLLVNVVGERGRT
jgi:hypothetical protein